MYSDNEDTVNDTEKTSKKSARKSISLGNYTKKLTESNLGKLTIILRCYHSGQRQEAHC